MDFKFQHMDFSIEIGCRDSDRLVQILLAMAPNQVKSRGQTQILKTRPGKCQKYKKKERRPIPYLDDDIMWNIFNRVPAISLFDNCRFLCKLWSKLICNQNFMKAHFLQSNPGILVTEKLKIQGEDMHVLKFMEFKETEIVKVHHLHTSKEELTVLSNCGGLSIVLDPHSWNDHVMNLVTKESIQLPPLGKRDSAHNIVFDRANMNYKIVFRSCTGKRYSKLTITVLELDGSYKRIKGPEFDALGTPVLVNGVLYFEAEQNGLFCLDLSTETFCYIRWPINIDNSSHLIEILDVGGLIGCVMTSRNSEEITIWILREEKWVQICRIDAEQPLPGETWIPPRFLGCLGREEDLFVFSRDIDRSSLYAYNVKTKQWMMIKPADNHYCDRICVSSILPLPSKMVS